MLLGVLWSVMEPLGLLLMMTLVFGFLLRVNSDGYPYPVFVFSGLAGWLVFSRAPLSVAASLSDNMGLFSQVYFPRLVLHIPAMARALLERTLMMANLLVLALASWFVPTFLLLAHPLCFLA